MKKGAEETSKGRRKNKQERRKEVKKEAKGRRNKEKTVEKSYRMRVARGRGKVVAQPTSRLRSIEWMIIQSQQLFHLTLIALTNLCSSHNDAVYLSKEDRVWPWVAHDHCVYIYIYIYRVNPLYSGHLKFMGTCIYALKRCLF